MLIQPEQPDRCRISVLFAELVRPHVCWIMDCQRPSRNMRAFVLGCALLCGGVQGLAAPAVLAHAGHGDEFVPNGEVEQVKASPEQDQLLGIDTAAPQSTPDGQLTVPSVAIVDAEGKPLVFVRSGSTYDPVFVQLGPVSADRTVVLEGVSADEQVVVSGALSLYAESQKKDRPAGELSPAGSADDDQAGTETETETETQVEVEVEVETAVEPASSSSPAWLLPGGIGVAVLVILAVVLGFRGRGPGSKQG